jgi:hypothetical protein
MSCVSLNGCTDDASAILAPALAADVIEALVFTVPDYASPAVAGPALSGPGDDPDGDDSEPPDDVERPLQRIIDPRTITGLWPGKAWAEGANRYVGNVGRIETTAKVTFEGQSLAEQPVVIQDHVPFIFDFGQIKFITAFAPVSTDHECGLTVRGSSLHAASWQFFTGAGAPAWGEAIVTTVATHSSQPICPVDDPGPTGVSGPGPGGSTCHYRIEYDLDSGQVISVELLYCSASLGDGL